MEKALKSQQKIALPVGRVNWASLKTRALTALLAGIPAVLVFYWGSPWVELMATLLCGAMALEWSRLVSAGELSGSSVLMTVTSVSAIILLVLNNPTYAAVILLLGSLLTYISSRLDRQGRSLWMALGCYYVALPCLSLIWLHSSLLGGRMLLLWLVGLVWLTDIFAYVGGMLIGGKKLAPFISPNKTWAGSLTGLAAAMVWGVGFQEWANLPSHWLWMVILSGAFSVLAQIGDLLESAVKRHFGVKDSGNWLPGHGGLLDRIDGFTLTLPLLLWLLMGASSAFTLFVAPF